MIVGTIKEYLNNFTVARIGFERKTYIGREFDEVINVTVAVLAGTLSWEVVARIYSMDSSAKCDFILFAL